MSFRLLVSSLFALTLLAQQRTGSLSGVILDQTRAAISGATAELSSPATGFSRSARADSGGEFRFPFIPVGVYRITVSKTGFQSRVQEGIAISVNEVPRLQITLAVAASEQTITVVEAAPMVNAVNASNGVVIGSGAIESLPLNGRNFIALGTLIPGAVATPARFETQGLPAARNGFSVNGQRTQSNNFLLDGVSNNDPHLNGYVLSPPPDALSEFKILTSNFSAEFGVNSGSVVNAITRGGTNKTHGALWDFLRNDARDARNFFTSGERPPLRQNQFGASAGAPIIKDRTFIFGYYEGLRAREGTVQNILSLTGDQRQGNLNGTGVLTVDPTNNQPFPGNILPSSRLDPVAQRLLADFVLQPNSGNRVVRNVSVASDSDQYGLRGDHRFSDRSSLFVRYAFARSERRNPLGAGNFSPSGSNSEDASHSAVISETHAFSPSLLNEFNMTFVRQFSRPSTWSGVDPRNLGFAYVPTEPSALGVPGVTLSGLFSIGDVAQSYTQLARNSYQIYDNVSWIKGRHSIRAGVDLRQNQIFLVFPNRPNGDYTFSGQFSRNTIGDYLLGLPQQFRQGGGQPAKHFVGYLYGFYLQDDIRVTRRLTLNAGVRYELPLPYYDKQDRLASFQPGRQSTVQPKAPAGLLFPGDAGVPRATIATDKNNFAPRFGFAYDLNGDGKTSIRGGYGIFYDATPAVAAFQNINVPPFNRFVQIDYRPPTLPSFANPYRDFAVNPQTDPAGNFPCPCLVIGFSPDFRSAYAQHFNFTLQHQFARNLIVEAGYAASLGRKLAGYLEVNPATPGAAPVQQRRLYRDYTLIRPTFSRFNSSYNALQLRVEKRLSAGLGFSVAYTWSKAIDFQSSVNFSGETRPQDAFSLSDVRGLAAFDVRHRFVSYFSYELPWMKTNRFVGGWQLQGIVAAQTGGPLTAFDSVDRTGRALSADRPDQIRNPNGGPKLPERWFDTGAFAALPNGSPRSGTAGRNTITGPGFVQTDLNLMKSIRVRESQRIEFRAEAFNVINRPNFFDPATNISAPQTFGAIQTARPARILQLALKYHF